MSEMPGIYIMVDGVIVPAATVPGAKGTTGDPGPQGPPGEQGPAGVGVYIGPDEPADPVSNPIWVKTVI